MIIVKALIREFLIKHNLQQTLISFDNEFQLRDSITRMDLILNLGMSTLIKRNNQSQQPLKTIIEILVTHLINKKALLEATTIATKAEKIEDIPKEIVYDPTQNGVSRLNKMKKRPQSEYKPKNLSISQEEYEQIIEESQNNDNKPSPNKGAYDIPKKDSTSKQQNKLFEYETHVIKDIINQDNNKLKEVENQPNTKFLNLSIKKQSNSNQQNDIQQDIITINQQQQEIPYIKYEDVKQHNIQIDQIYDYNKSINFNQMKRKPQLKPIILDIKKLLFQNTMGGLPKSWSQPFLFTKGQTFFGLHQLEGGPCGVLASVQAYYLKHYLFSQKNYTENTKFNCLIASFADIFYKSNQTKLILVIPVRGSNSNYAIPIECCDQLEYTLRSKTHLYEILIENNQNDQLFFGQNGVALFFYSLVLTKGVQEIQNEMDQSNNPLIGNHGHCTQEAVNLMLTGQATSNCFDGIQQIEDMKIKGVTQQSEIGFLTIFEHLQYIKVGKYLKEPILPIWVICKEYHYSVIFGCNQNIINDSNTGLKEFDLFFFDGLNNPDDLIRLTIRRLGAQKGIKAKRIQIEGVQFESDGKNAPLIEGVLKTKYGELELDWNDSVMIL